MAKTLIGNIKGKNGRGITSIKKTGTDGSVDTYTITYTDSTTSTFTINNSDSISLQRQIVPSAAVESSATASQAYAAGDYVVVNGVLRKVTAAIAKGNAISDSNSAATTITGELATVAESVQQAKTFLLTSPCLKARGNSDAPAMLKVCGNVCTLFVNGLTTRTLYPNDELLNSEALAQIGEYLPDYFDSEQQRKSADKSGERFVGCRLYGGSDPHLQMIKDELLGSDSEMRFVFTWVR